MPLVLFAIQNFQSGWRIEEDILEIKAFTIKRKIKISLTQIALIGKESEWSPQFRICGVGIPGLLAGKCRLRNKKQAVVFQHLEQSEQLLIETNCLLYTSICIFCYCLLWKGCYLWRRSTDSLSF